MTVKTWMAALVAAGVAVAEFADVVSEEGFRRECLRLGFPVVVYRESGRHTAFPTLEGALDEWAAAQGGTDPVAVVARGSAGFEEFVELEPGTLTPGQCATDHGGLARRVADVLADQDGDVERVRLVRGPAGWRVIGVTFAAA